jgi:hypothetical protein
LLNSFVYSLILFLLASSSSLSARLGLATVALPARTAEVAALRVPADLSIVGTLLALTLERSGEESAAAGASELFILSRLVRSVVCAAAASAPVVDVCGFGYTSTDSAASNLVGMSAVILAEVVALLNGGGAKLASAATADFVRAVVLPLLGAMAATWVEIPHGRHRSDAQWRAPDAALVRVVADVALRSAALPRERAPPWRDALTAVAANLLGKCVVQLVCIYEPVAARSSGAPAAPMMSSEEEEVAGGIEETDAAEHATGSRVARLLLAPVSPTAASVRAPSAPAVWKRNDALLRALRRAVAPRRAIERRSAASGGSALAAAENALAAALIWHGGLLPHLHWVSENSDALLRGGGAEAEEESKVDGVEADEKTRAATTEHDAHQGACFVALAAAFRKAALALRSWSAREARRRPATQAELCADAEKRARMLLLLPCETPRRAWASGAWRSCAPGDAPSRALQPDASPPLHVPRKQGVLRTMLREECGLSAGDALDAPPASVADAGALFILLFPHLFFCFLIFCLLLLFAADAVVRFVRASRVTTKDWRRRLRDRRRRGNLRATALGIAAECVAGLPSNLAISHVLAPLAVTTLRVTATVARAAARASAPPSGVPPSPALPLPFAVCRFSDTLEPLPLSTAAALQKAFTAIMESSFDWGGFGTPRPCTDELQRAQLTSALLWSTALLPAEAHLLDALVPRLRAVLQRARATSRPPLALADAPGANAHPRASVARPFDWIATEEGSMRLDDDVVEVESIVLESEHPYAPDTSWLQMIDVRAVDGDTVVVRFDARTSTEPPAGPPAARDGGGGAAPVSYIQFFFDEACTQAATAPLFGPCGSECWRHALHIPQAECYLRFQSGATNASGSWGYRCSIRGDARRGSALALAGGAALSAPHISARLLFHTMRGVLTGAAWRREERRGGDSAVAQRVRASLTVLLDELAFAVDAAVRRCAAYTAARPPAVQLRSAAVVGAEIHLWLRFIADTWSRIASSVRVEQAPRVWALLLRIADELPPLVGRHALRTLGAVMPGVPVAGGAERECALPSSTVKLLFALAAECSPLAPTGAGAAVLRCTSAAVPLRSTTDRCDQRFARSHCAIDAVELLQKMINCARGVRAVSSPGRPEALCASVVTAVRAMLRGLRAWTPRADVAAAAPAPSIEPSAESSAAALQRGALALRIVAGLSSSGVLALRLEAEDVQLIVRFATAGSGGALDAALVSNRTLRYERDLAVDALGTSARTAPEGDRSEACARSEQTASQESQAARRAVELAAVTDADEVMQRMLRESLRDSAAQSEARPSGAGDDADKRASTPIYWSWSASTRAQFVDLLELHLKTAFTDLIVGRQRDAKRGKPLSVDGVSSSYTDAAIVARACAMLEERTGTRCGARTIVRSIRAAEARLSAPASNALRESFDKQNKKSDKQNKKRQTKQTESADVAAADHLVAAGPGFARNVAVVSALRIASVAALASIAQSGGAGTALLWSVRDEHGGSSVAVALGRLVRQEAAALDAASVAAKQKATMLAVDAKGVAGAGSGGGPEQERRSVVVESTHNYADNMDFCERVTIEGAAELHVVFDSRSQTEKRYDFLEIFSDCTLTTRVGPRFEGSAFPHTDPTHPLTVAGDSLWYTFKSDASTNYWGYAFTVSATVLNTPAASRAPSILRAFPLPRSVNDIIDSLDATLWLQCRVATVAECARDDAAAAAAQAAALGKVEAAGASLEDLTSSLLRNGAASGAAGDEELAETLDHDEATRMLALELARQVREVLQQNAREQEASRALEKVRDHSVLVFFCLFDFSCPSSLTFLSPFWKRPPRRRRRSERGRIMGAQRSRRRARRGKRRRRSEARRRRRRKKRVRRPRRRAACGRRKRKQLRPREQARRPSRRRAKCSW